MFDLAVSSQRFAAGVGLIVVHNSPRRGADFVTQKIARGAARIAAGFDTELRLGNLDARRDWGHARDYVEAMWLMLQQEQPDDYVIASGEEHSVREFCRLAFETVVLDYRNHVVVDLEFLRPAEVDVLCGDAAKARIQLGWQPRITFAALVREMVLAEIRRAEEPR